MLNDNYIKSQKLKVNCKCFSFISNIIVLQVQNITNTLYSSNQVRRANDDIFSVYIDEKSDIVHLKEKIYTCSRFQVDQLSCEHTIAVLRELNEEPYSYCSVYYNKDIFLVTYNVTVYPLPTLVIWNIPNKVKDMLVLPSKSKVRPEKPKKEGLKLHGKAKLNTNVADVASMDTIKRHAETSPRQHKIFEYFLDLFSI